MKPAPQLFLASVLGFGCGLGPPASVPPFDCDRIDRAGERFPDECGGDAGEDEASDAGVEGEP